MDSTMEEKIVMTPKKKTAMSTTLKMERTPVLPSSTASNGGGTNNGGNTGKKSSLHLAGGNNAGIVVNRDLDDKEDLVPAEMNLQFRVFLRSSITQRYAQERRVLSFWFKQSCPASEHACEAQEFFKCLVCPTDFPRDYVGFIKKMMKLMQNQFPRISKVEIEMTQEMEMDQLPERPKHVLKESKARITTSSASQDSDDSSSTTSIEPAGSDDVLAAIEMAYPNSLTINDMATRLKSEKELIRQLVSELVERKLVKPVGGAGVPAGLPETVDPATGAFRRVHNKNEENVTVLRQIARSLGGFFANGSGGEAFQQPTIAIITSHYFEKMAVDSMIQNKRTFVRYATVGEANVYTLGNIGAFKVVSTKLPMTGRTRDALIATGSTTTRLLGTFQDVEQVFLVGVGGGVPHYTDFSRHVRLGDVVLSAPLDIGDLKGPRYIYQYCEATSEQPGDGGRLESVYETKSWCPPDLTLQEIARTLVNMSKQEQGGDTSNLPWMDHYEEALKVLMEDAEESESEISCESARKNTELWMRPSSSSDRLYMCVGNNDVIEVGHPEPKTSFDPRSMGLPVLHLGPVASGRCVAMKERIRQDFSARTGVLAYDNELDSVVESVYGNRKERYMLIRGVADYKDGTCGSKDWQQYAAIMAAAVMKDIILRMPELGLSSS